MNPILHLADRAARAVVLRLAARHRAAFSGVHVVAITGSCGKTTTKDLVAAVLSSRYRTTGSRWGQNSRKEAALAVLRTPRCRAACVIEVGAWTPGTVRRTAGLCRPTVAVVINVMTDHYSSFRGRAGVAAEKSALVELLEPGGTAVLNADDDLVAAMASRAPGPVFTFGLSPGAALRAEEVRSDWPDPLQGVLVRGNERVPFRTRLHGRHWVYGVLAAASVGVVLGFRLEDVARAIEGVESQPGRLFPVGPVGGVTFVDDGSKNSLDSIPASLEFVRSARAARKAVVFGHIADYPGALARKYGRVAAEAGEVADLVVFVGPNAHTAVKRLPGDGKWRAFATAREADAFLLPVLREGDLVLLKGCGRADHLERLYLSRTMGVRCWRDRCGRTTRCEDCRLRTTAG